MLVSPKIRITNPLVGRGLCVVLSGNKTRGKGKTRASFIADRTISALQIYVLEVCWKMLAHAVSLVTRARESEDNLKYGQQCREYTFSKGK